METYLLCNCLGYTHEEIEEMMKEGNFPTLQAFREDTFIGTGCGRCLPVLDDIFRKVAAEF